MAEDALGDRMKLYERAEAGRRFMPLLPIIARMDGRGFSKFTRGMRRPYDSTLSALMVAVTCDLVRETNACVGYTQSDEITLAWHSLDMKTQVYFDGRIHKMVSQLAVETTLAFYIRLKEMMPEYVKKRPRFDARAWQVPNRTEGANVFLWREWDATKNSLTMAASEFYSPKQLHGKRRAEKHEMLFAKGVNWNDYPASFKRGTYVQRRRVVRPFTAAEIETLPPKHAARTNPNLSIERWTIGPVEMPVFSTITNREAVVFEGAEPQVLDATLVEAA